MTNMLEQPKIAIIGLGYVGLPLAVEFAKKYPVVGFDVKQQRVKELSRGHDVTREVTDEQLQQVLAQDKQQAVTKDITPDLFVTHETADIQECNIYMVTVPTPIDKHKTPDLQPLLKASETVGKVLSEDDVVIYESTVHPGATEE